MLLIFEVFAVHQPGDENSRKYVVKCIPLPSGKGKGMQIQTKIANTLYYELMLHKGVLLDFKYAPKLPASAYGEDLGYRYLVMERLDMDLKAFAQIAPGPSVKSVANVGLQILDGLKRFHEKGHIFVDVKPDNFMVSFAEKRSTSNEFGDEDRVVFVDYGLVEKFTAVMSGGHKIQADRASVAGTPAFASLSVHQGSNPSRKDDIEALVCCMYCAYLRMDELPLL